MKPIGKRVGDRRGDKAAPGSRRMSGSVNPNGMSGHTKTGESLGGFPNAGAALIPEVRKRPRLSPLPGAGANRYFTPRVGRQRPMKANRQRKGGSSAY